jgi:hypothetical protein
MKTRDGCGVRTALAIGLLLASAAGSAALAQEGKKVVGYLYTTTNGEGINQVVRLARYADGSLGDEKTYPTWVRGASNHTAPAMGDYDAQGQTQIVGDHLLTANPGAHSVSVLRIDRPTGALTLVGSVNSYGDMPVSITSTPVVGQPGKYWVVVGNQWGQPTVIYDGDKISSRVYMYDFADGRVAHRRHFEEAGIAGSVGFEWGPQAELLYVTNFSITNAKGDNGLTVLRDQPDRLIKIANYPTGQTNPKDIDEACWTTLSLGGRARASGLSRKESKWLHLPFHPT